MIRLDRRFLTGQGLEKMKGFGRGGWFVVPLMNPLCDFGDNYLQNVRGEIFQME
jgi:hypothetical protein